MPNTRDHIKNLLCEYPENEMNVQDILDNIPVPATAGGMRKALSDMTKAGIIVRTCPGWYACVLPRLAYQVAAEKDFFVPVALH